jgi:hypothetical protein
MSQHDLGLTARSVNNHKQPICQKALDSESLARKIVTVKVPSNLLQKFPPSRLSPTMDSEPDAFPQPLEETNKLIKRGGLRTKTTDLALIKASLEIVYERHGEILKEKEDRVLALQYKLSNQQSKENELSEEIMKLKERNLDLESKVNSI